MEWDGFAFWGTFGKMFGDIFDCHYLGKGLPSWLNGKESTCNAGDISLIPGLGRSPGGGHDTLLQYSCLENAHGERSLAG